MRRLVLGTMLIAAPGCDPETTSGSGGEGDACASADLFVLISGDGDDQRYEARGPNAATQRPHGHLGDENNLDFFMGVAACASATSSDGCIRFEAFGIRMAGDVSLSTEITYFSPGGVEYFGDVMCTATLDSLGAVGAPMTGTLGGPVEEVGGTNTLDLSGSFAVCRGDDIHL